MLRGLLHCHSTYSDGEFSLPELREVLSAEGCSFVAMTDHAEWFDAAKLRRYVQECEALTDDRFLFIPGLEFECEERFHIVGYGTAALTSRIEPAEVLRHVLETGGVAVIAHPPDLLFPSIRELAMHAHGIEVWNTKSDGRYAPRATPFDLLGELRARNRDLHAFYGADLHWRRQFRGLHTLVDADVLDPGAILAALVRGAFAGACGELRLPADGVLPPELLARFDRVNRRSRRFWQLTATVKQAADSVGWAVPAPLKSQLRRLF